MQQQQQQQQQRDAHAAYMLEILDKEYCNKQTTIRDFWDKSTLLLAIELRGVDIGDRLGLLFDTAQLTDLVSNHDKKDVQMQCFLAVYTFAMLAGGRNARKSLTKFFLRKFGAERLHEIVSDEINDIESVNEDAALFVERFSRMCKITLPERLSESWRQTFAPKRDSVDFRQNYTQALCDCDMMGEAAVFIVHMIASKL